jgi:hypothetical protein
VSGGDVADEMAADWQPVSGYLLGEDLVEVPEET